MADEIVKHKDEPPVVFKGEMTDERVREILLLFIETSTTAMDMLAERGYKGDRKRAVAEVLRSGVVSPPKMFPGSAGCVQFGRAIAEYILAQSAII